MSGVTLTHRIDDKQLRRVLKKLEKLGQDPEEVMAGIGEVLLGSVAQRFRDDVDPAPATRRRHCAQARGGLQTRPIAVMACPTTTPEQR